LRESISASKLYRDISPTRVFASAATAEGRTTLPDLFKKKGGLQSLRPSYSPVPEDEDPEAFKSPKLLGRLEMLLDEKLSLVSRLGATNKGFAAIQMRTDAYRQVFDAFLHSFTTYRSVLMRIKHEYDVSLDDALASVYDHVHMKAEIAAADERMETGMLDAKNRALEDAAAVRKELQDQYEMQEQVALEAEERCLAAETEIQRRRANIAALKAEAAELQRSNRALKLQLLSSSTWASPSLLKKYEPLPEPAAGAAGDS